VLRTARFAFDNAYTLTIIATASMLTRMVLIGYRAKVVLLVARMDQMVMLVMEFKPNFGFKFD
jgi:hypothetical protein